ncbi:Ku protein [Clostridiales bacterium BAD-6]|uniref:Non-homologous end joining protein Ku n=2 Tax=Sinanaerobacter chloroacetimidivorans TaxID=2818044 RepID=A0A8J8B0G5_9FIRM|nr:Ku protein [Sinanaerobacter chloroacetimidivorans]MBR0597159.1 Ku protein [Sinanaerobacter chloroacetimidivorans]
MAVSHKGAISFGLVYIPVALYTATQDNDIHFNQLHKEDHSRIRYKKTCAHCGKEVSGSDIIKGFEYDKDKYVVVTDEDFEKIKTEKDRTIQILHFADLETINPIYYEKSYHTIPETGGEKAFELLRTAMKDESKVAIAKTVMGNKETLLAIIPTEDNILINTMFFEDDIKELPKAYAKPELKDEELTMAKNLIQTMVRSFEPALYKDEYQERLRGLIEQKIAGKEIVAAKEEEKSNVIDLMEALKKSIEQNQPAEPPKKKRGPAKKEQPGA